MLMEWRLATINEMYGDRPMEERRLVRIKCTMVIAPVSIEEEERTIEVFKQKSLSFDFAILKYVLKMLLKFY